MIKNFEQLKEMLKAMPVKRKVAVVPAQDEHTLEAISHAYRDGMVEPVLIGAEPKIREILAQIGTDADKMTIIHVEDPTEAIQKAADMARDGEVDCIMKGKTEESPNYHKVFAITDVGLLTYPSKDQKKAAIQNAVEAFHALGVEQPKVAILAAVEKVNPKMKETVEAAEIKEEGVEGCIIEGPISYDLAMDPASAPIKGYVSPVAGDADLLVVPDIVSGNIAAKTITVIGGGRTGGVVLGAKVPVLLVSRAASADDKYMSIVIAALVGSR